MGDSGRPVLADDPRALDLVAEIAGVLARHKPDPRDWTLARGSAGVALFLAEAGLASGDERLQDAAATLLDAAVDGAAAAPPSTALYTGTLGVGWLLSHLDGRLFGAGDAADDVDDLVAARLAAHPPVVDLTNGLAGVGVYLLERLPRERAYDGLVRVVALLAGSVDGAGRWRARPEYFPPEEREQYPGGYLSAGVAHGQAGVVALLARLHAAGVDGAGPLLRRAADGLTALRREGMDGDGRYPALVSDDVDPRGRSRVAWCYGDPGVAVALLAAGRALGDAGVEAEALATARAAAARPLEGSFVVDSGLCHGSAGLVHVFARLAAATGDDRYAGAARRWFEVLLRQRVPGAPYAGFQAILDVAAGPVPTAAFLEGAAGVGLALLGAARPEPFSWDATLLTDLARADGGTAEAPPSG